MWSNVMWNKGNTNCIILPTYTNINLIAMHLEVLHRLIQPKKKNTNFMKPQKYLGIYLWTDVKPIRIFTVQN